MDHFARLADDLVDVIEELEQPPLARDGRAVVRALRKAVEEANLTARARRKRREGDGYERRAGP